MVGMNQGIFLDRRAVHARVMSISAGGNQKNDGKEGHGYHPASKRVLPGWDSGQGRIPSDEGVYGTSLLCNKYICGNPVSQCEIGIRRFQRKMGKPGDALHICRFEIA
jgi:hypothetical protein